MDVLCEALLSNRTYEMVDDLVACGHRLAGTQSERDAVSLLKRRMDDYELASVRDQSFEAISLPHCPSAQLEGDRALVGYGMPSDFQERRGELAGKVIIVDAQKSSFAANRPMHRRDRCDRACDAGVTCLYGCAIRTDFSPRPDHCVAGVVSWADAERMGV